MNLLLDLPPGTGLERLGVQKGDLFARGGAALRLGPLRILLDRAEAWTPPRLAPKEMKAAGIRRRLEDLARELGTRENPPGLGDLYRAALRDPEADPPAAISPLAARALPHARAFSEGLDKRDAALLRRGAGGLIGLGPGLTPSGDDFLGGWLTTLRCVEGRGFSRPELDLAAAEALASAAGKTPLISRALLRCALEGASSESIHHLLNAILGGPVPAGPEALARAVREALRRGHSSGWDALAGVAWGLRSLMERLRKAGEQPEIRFSANSASP
ncbi:MAG: DUF2877 domain-containing protein [Candidatus Tectomicrobia bacterium]|nr:DUF2877 domain-containing protein [Candidatus Tectomicrobia bacterium]